jgi:hypothetical protein
MRKKHMTKISFGEIERLQRIRIQMESRLARVEKEQKTLEEETKIIREKVAIQELQRTVRNMRDELAGIHKEKKELKEKVK